MRIIETKIHGYLDYLMGILLILVPGILGLDLKTPAGAIPMALGIMTIIYSLITAYELSVTNIISMPAHLAIDLVSGIFLAASPWLFGFADVIFLPHLLAGIAEIMASMMTKTKARVKAPDNNVL